MYKDFSRMSASGRKSASKAAQLKLDSVQCGSDSGSFKCDGSAKRIGVAVNEYCNSTLLKLKQTEEIVRSLQKLGEVIGSLNDEKKVLKTAKGICETVENAQRIIGITKVDTMQLGMTVDEHMDILKSKEKSGVASTNEKEYNVSFVSDIDISHENDGYSAYHINSTQTLDDGRLLLADYWNKTIKLIDNSQNVTYALKCKGYPWGMSKVKNNEFAVTITDSERIQIITADDDTLKVTEEIAVGEPCRGIFYHKENFYVACAGMGNEGPGHLQIIPIDGKPKVIKFDKSGKQLFSRPRQVFVNSRSDEVFITDADDVKVLDLQGREVRRIKDSCLKSPYGICGDDTGGILISGFISNNVVRVDSRNNRVIQVIADGQIRNPVSLFLHPKTSLLFVGMERNKNLKLFSVAK